MKFTPKSKEEIVRENLFPAGVYPFTVISAEDAISKRTGKEMIKVELNVFGDDGRQIRVTDYLMEAMIGKLLDFCEQTGIGGLYEAGTLTAADCENREGFVKLKIEPGTDEFPNPKNAVAKYCSKPQAADAQKGRKMPVEDDGSDVPF